LLKAGISKKENDKSLNFLSVLCPNDLNIILDKLTEGNKTKIKNNYRVLEILEMCPPDCRNIITNYIEEPNSIQVLSARARAGDKRVKGLILQNLRQSPETKRTEFSTFSDEYKNLFEIIEPFANIAEPNEISEIISETIQNNDPCQWSSFTKRGFYKCLSFLPDDEALKFLNIYLGKTSYEIPRSWSGATDLRDVLSKFSDAALAENIFHRMLEAPMKIKPFDDIQIYGALQSLFGSSRDMSPELRKALAYSFDKNSIEFFRQQLDCKDEDVRAYSIWQLERLNYKWKLEEIKKIIDDPYWKVRINAVLINDADLIASAKNDSNTFVKLFADIFSKRDF